MGVSLAQLHVHEELFQVNFPGVNTEVANRWIREWIDETIAGFGGAKFCPT